MDLLGNTAAFPVWTFLLSLLWARQVANSQPSSLRADTVSPSCSRPLSWLRMLRCWTIKITSDGCCHSVVAAITTHTVTEEPTDTLIQRCSAWLHFVCYAAHCLLLSHHQCFLTDTSFILRTKVFKSLNLMCFPQLLQHHCSCIHTCIIYMMMIKDERRVSNRKLKFKES